MQATQLRPRVASMPIGANAPWRIQEYVIQIADVQLNMFYKQYLI